MPSIFTLVDRYILLNTVRNRHFSRDWIFNPKSIFTEAVNWAKLSVYSMAHWVLQAKTVFKGSNNSCSTKKLSGKTAMYTYQQILKYLTQGC